MAAEVRFSGRTEGWTAYHGGCGRGPNGGEMVTLFSYARPSEVHRRSFQAVLIL